MDTGALLIETQTDFDLPHDYQVLIELSGGVRGVRRNHIVDTPSEFVHIPESKIKYQ